jgi:hypothetical protein
MLMHVYVAIYFMFSAVGLQNHRMDRRYQDGFMIDAGERSRWSEYGRRSSEFTWCNSGLKHPSIPGVLYIDPPQNLALPGRTVLRRMFVMIKFIIPQDCPLSSELVIDY